MSQLPTIVFGCYPFGRPKDHYPPPLTADAAAERERMAKQAEFAARTKPARELWLKRFKEGDEPMKAILEVCRQSSESVRITSLVNQVAKIADNRTWKDFERKKVEQFGVMKVMIKQGRLDRVGRRSVTVARSDAKFKAYIDSILKDPDLPEPQFGDDRPHPSPSNEALVAQLRQQQEIRKRQLLEDDFMTKMILETLHESKLPILITTLANETVAKGKFPRWKVAFEFKRRVFKRIGFLIRCRRIERVKRKFVTLPRDNTKWEAYKARANEPLNLPEPNL